jgi:dTDP-4-amino-4,6-dideoxy-D-galactose acyltransferase
MIQDLDFDSKFFNKKIGKLILSSETDSINIKKELESARQLQYDCIYLEINDSQIDIFKMDQYSNMFLVDYRLVMIKILQGKYEKQKINIRDNFNAQDDFIDNIAEQICFASRFYKDRVFRHQAKALYCLWLKKSLFEEYSLKYFIAFINETPAGIVTLKEKQGNLYIDLFGVLKNYQRQGVGRQLINTASSWAEKKGYKSISLNTQKNNKIAVKAYKTYDFEECLSSKIYHYHINYV